MENCGGCGQKCGNGVLDLCKCVLLALSNCSVDEQCDQPGAGTNSCCNAGSCVFKAGDTCRYVASYTCDVVSSTLSFPLSLKLCRKRNALEHQQTVLQMSFLTMASLALVVLAALMEVAISCFVLQNLQGSTEMCAAGTCTMPSICTCGGQNSLCDDQNPCTVYIFLSHHFTFWF